MATEKATALVIRGTDWSETSRIATLWTREFGKVRALAKGGRRLKSNFESAFDLLSVCDVVFLRKAHGGLDLLTEARVRERFPELRSDLRSLYLGYYIAELLSDGTFDYDPHPPLFDAALATLRSLRDPTVDRWATASAFELVWLRELGYCPRFETCAACGTALVPQFGSDRVVYSAATGGVVCGACVSSVSDRRTLTVESWRALRMLATGDESALLPGVRREVRALLGQTVSGILGRRPKMLNYVDAAGSG